MKQKHKIIIGLLGLMILSLSLFMINADQRLPEVKTLNIPIEEGQVCLPYTPHGQFLYDAKWTGQYPDIEKYEGDFQTITLGMG